MQFVANGPDIPEELLQAQEEARVVFFCGAGISYPAGLPGFQGLVDDIYKELGTTKGPIEKRSYDRSEFDATLDLLERRLPGDGLAMRRAVPKVLKPNLRRKGAIDTHAALLQLARTRHGVLRLITTNFDRVFESALKRSQHKVHTFAAPLLPIPKNSRWDGLVYLHGLMPSNPDDSTLRRLVLTSGDFGLAYLTERWAARFVSELFRYYTVCFVGYSINDPVLRYMMDALAADRRLGETSPKAYALGDCAPGDEKSKSVEWEAKGVTPILYDPAKKHAALHGTLKAWAETWRDGVLGKERIVVDYAIARPSGSTKQDDFVSRMLWALSHESGLPAKRFSEFNPVPALDWLDAFIDARYVHSDLPRFSVPARSKVDGKLRFSLLRRPAPYDLTPWMELVPRVASGSNWDAVMFQLGRWLARHLNDPKVILWVANSGGNLHERMASLIEEKLDGLAKLANEGKQAELDEIRSNAPNAIPSSPMRTLWRLILAGRVKSSDSDFDLYRWKDRLKRDGLTTTVRLQLRQLLRPMIMLSEPIHWPGERALDEPVESLSQLVRWELVLAADHARDSMKDLGGVGWEQDLAALLDDLQRLLRDALDLLQEMGVADEYRDGSHWDMPSISPHWQNRGFRDWVTLIELLRDSWLQVRLRNPAEATNIAYIWFQLPYATFKRLALYCAGQSGVIAPENWVDWLLVDGAWWLWSVETKRETLRLLVQQGGQLGRAQARLEAAILGGPPRKMFRADLEGTEWDDVVARETWLILAKLNESGATLGPEASQRFRLLSAAHPMWGLASNERDEFSHWMSGTGDPDFAEGRHIDIAPRTRKQLLAWLSKPAPDRQRFDEDTWREVCRSRFFHAWAALCDLSGAHLWPVMRWREALQAWSEDSLVVRSWRFAAPLVETMPDHVLVDLAHAVSWWVSSASKSIDRHRASLLSISRRMLALNLDPDVGIRRNGRPVDDPVGEAINHPIGLVTQALLNLWFKRQPSDNEGLPEDLKTVFTMIADRDVERFRHGRVLLASQLIALFRVDRTWAETYLLTLFNWTTDEQEAKAAWEAFFWSPRLYAPLMIALKEQFLACAERYAYLGDHAGQFAAFITYTALRPPDGYTPEDFRVAIAALPQEGLREVARVLSQAQEASGEKREEYWNHRVRPFWQRVWPKSRDFASSTVAESLARLCIAARDEFTSAITTLADWLQPIAHPDFVVHRLDESGLCNRFPSDALRFLDAIIDNQRWAPRDLMRCLDSIRRADERVASDRRFQRLFDYARRHGQ